VSATFVLITEGDKRAALNMFWEWIGIGVAALLIRRMMRNREAGDWLLSMIVISGVVLAGVGIWQHFYWYPRLASQIVELDELESRLTAAESSSDPSAIREQRERAETLRRELGWTAATDAD